jgi:hypothetical protein
MFRSAPIAEFAKILAADVAKRYPPELDKDPAKRPSVNRVTRIVEDAAQKAAEFRAANKLGWLGKARLGNSFRWELAQLGYHKEFVDVATEAVVVYLTRGPAATAPTQE